MTTKGRQGRQFNSQKGATRHRSWMVQASAACVCSPYGCMRPIHAPHCHGLLCEGCRVAVDKALGASPIELQPEDDDEVLDVVDDGAEDVGELDGAGQHLLTQREEHLRAATSGSHNRLGDSHEEARGDMHRHSLGMHVAALMTHS